MTAIATIAILIAATTAKAQTFTYTASGAIATEMDHHLAYSWRISNVNLPAGQEVIAASLVFDNIENWDANANKLHLHLFDTTRQSGVQSFIDDNPNHSLVTDLTDDFVSTRYHNGTNAVGASASWLISSTTPGTLLTNVSFTNHPTDWTYNFDATEIDLLDTFIRNGQNFGLGLDSDCHYYYSSLKVKIWTAPVASQQVPEAGTMALLGMGLLPLTGIALRRRK